MTTLTTPIANATANDLVFISQTNSLVTDSRYVAEYFAKRHDNVVRAIKSLGCSSKFNRLNFEGVHYHDTKGEVRQAYQMTKDGFMFLVMGFTGKRAAEIKERYINAFNEMAEKLANKALPIASPIDELDFLYQRWLVVVEKGEVKQKRLLNNNESFFDSRQFVNYFKTPEVGLNQLDDLVELSRAVNERILQIAAYRSQSG